MGRPDRTGRKSYEERLRERRVEEEGRREEGEGKRRDPRYRSSPEFLGDPVQEVEREGSSNEGDQDAPERRSAAERCPDADHHREHGGEGGARRSVRLVAFDGDVRVPRPVPVGPVVEETRRRQGPDCRLDPRQRRRHDRTHAEEEQPRESEYREDERPGGGAGGGK